MIELISTISDIVFLLAFVAYVKHNQKKWLFTCAVFEEQDTAIDKLKAQQQKDRSDIADYLNEQLKNK